MYQHLPELMFTTVLGEETVKSAVILSEVRTKWQTFCSLLAKKPEGSTATNDMLIAMFPNLNKIASYQFASSCVCRFC